MSTCVNSIQEITATHDKYELSREYPSAMWNAAWIVGPHLRCRGTHRSPAEEAVCIDSIRQSSLTRIQGLNVRTLDARICALLTYMPERSSSISYTAVPSASCLTAQFLSTSCSHACSFEFTIQTTTLRAAVKLFLKWHSRSLKLQVSFPWKYDRAKAAESRAACWSL